MTMINPIRIYILLLMVITGALSVACSDDDSNAKTVAEQQAEKLTGRWKVTAATLDGATQEGYAATIFALSSLTSGTNMSYSIEENPTESPWRLSSGGRLFFDTQDAASYLTRDDDVRIAYEVTETGLIFEFTYAEPSENGRANGIVGEWKFTLAKQ
jgi:hypothetical protein